MSDGTEYVLPIYADKKLEIRQVDHGAPDHLDLQFVNAKTNRMFDKDHLDRQ